MQRHAYVEDHLGHLISHYGSRLRRRSISASVGSSKANDPVTISPAGTYFAITTPVLETLLSMSFNPIGIAPSENKRLPAPTTTGKVQTRYSSTRLFRNRVWIRFPLPCTWSSGPDPCFSAAMPSAASPSIRTELLQSSDRNVRDATNFVASFSGLAPASSGAFGQNAAKIS